MFQKTFLIAVALLPLLASCGTAERLNGMHELEGLRVVQADLQGRVQELGIETPGYTLQTVGTPGAGSHGGNGIMIGLVPADGGAVVELPLEYNYTFMLREGDSGVDVGIVYRPSDEELRTAIRTALGKNKAL